MERARTRIGLLLLVVLFLAIYGRYLVGFAPAGGDIVNQYLPYQQLIREAVRAGALPLWNDATFCGRPLMADIQVGVLYLPNWLHWILPLPVSFALVLALHGAWMIAGCWRLGRHWRLRPEAVVLGVVMWATASFFLLKLHSGVILFLYVGAWWPWLALAASRLSRQPGFAAMVWLCLALAMSLLAGAPQITYYGWLMALVLGLALPVEAAQAAERQNWARRMAWLGGAFVLALGLTAFQTAQTFQFISHSFERGAGAAFEFVAQGSLAPPLLWLLINPGLLGIGTSEGLYYFGSRLGFPEASFYAPLGMVVLLIPLGLGALWRNRSNERTVGESVDRLHVRLAWLGLVAMVAGFILALGEFSPLFRLFYDWAPGFDRFRLPARLMIFVTAGQALLAALGYHAWLERDRHATGERIWLIVGTLGLLALIWVPLFLRVRFWAWLGNPAVDGGQVIDPRYFAITSRHALDTATIVSGALVAAGAILWALSKPHPRGRRILVWCPAGVAALEMMLLTAPYHLVEPWGNYHETFYPETPMVQTLKREHRGGRVLWLDDVFTPFFDQNQYEVTTNRLIMQNLPQARGYDPINARWIGEWFNLLAGFDPERPPGGFMFVDRIARPAWLPLMAVETIVSYRNQSRVPGLTPVRSFEFAPDPLIPRPPNAPAVDRATIWRNDRFLGMAFAAPIEARGETWREALYLSAARADDPAIDPLKTVVIPETAKGALAIPTQIDARYQIEPLESGPNEFRFTVDFPSPALLCLAQSAYPGWVARVDGQYEPVTPYCGTFVALPIVGAHEVVFEFVPEGFQLGLLISLATLVVLIYGTGREWMRSRRQNKGQAQ